MKRTESLIRIEKQHQPTDAWAPLEGGTIRVSDRRVARVRVADSERRVYFEAPVKPGRPVRFAARGTAGRHAVEALDAAGQVLAQAQFVLKAHTRLTCNRGPYAQLLTRLTQMISANRESRPYVINGRSYYQLVCWSRDHVYTLKAAKYFIEDVTSGMDYWMESQLPNGMLWDNIERNTQYPVQASYLGEALGPGWFKYDGDGRFVVRRVPVLADTEYVFTEGVWYAWKATGDDAWMARQLPRLEKALRYMTTDPLRWSRKLGLVKRSFTADEWDFANPHYCNGDHRCIHPGDPQFLFHGNQSGLYAMQWRMAEMHEHLGDTRRAAELRASGEALRKRANARLWFGTHYGHMIPETLPEKQVYQLVGDERERMSLSTGYTINRGLPTHEMAVKIIREYQRRRKVNAGESFAEWWTMDPPYTTAQWPGQQTNTAGCPVGEYMNGGICTIIAGEIAKAAFDHGAEAYGVDILNRVWELCERDGNELHEVYRRLPAKLPPLRAKFSFVDLRKVVNRGLRNGATRGVEAWLGEGDNDLRNLPTGRRKFGAITFNILAPANHGGRAILRLDPADAPVEVPVSGRTAASLYFLHTAGRAMGAHGVAACYQVRYADGSEVPIYIRFGHEIGHWWGPCEPANTGVARIAWRGPNPTWKDVGIYMFGWNNPHPDKPIASITLHPLTTGTTVMLAAISLSDHPVKFATPIRSYGLPDCWAHGAVYHAIAEGLAGIEDKGRAFDRVKVAPHWAATVAHEADVTLHYPASDGYCSYRYRDNRRGQLTLDLTGSFGVADVHCQLPPGRKAGSVTMAGAPVAFRNTRVEKSNYVDFALDALPTGPVVIQYTDAGRGSPSAPLRRAHR